MRPVPLAWLVAIVVALLADAAMCDDTATTRPASARPIRVGITVSRATATGINPSGKPWGYDGQLRVMRDLAGADLRLVPVIEPLTGDDADLAALLSKSFPDEKPLDGSDADALKSLDVIVANEYWMAPAPVLEGFDKAVAGGVSFLNIGGMGWASPGFRSARAPQTLHLAGLTEGQGGYTDSTIQCNVLQDHPILGKIGQMKTLPLRPLGAFGLLPEGATPLVQAGEQEEIKTRGPAVSDTDYRFNAIYVSHYDKGKIVGIIFTANGLADKKLWHDLLDRSVHWLAGRDVK